MEEVQETLKEILQKYTEKEILNENISLIEDLEFDSLQLVAVLAEIEESFQISFDEGEKLLDMVDDLKEMVQYIEGLREQ